MSIVKHLFFICIIAFCFGCSVSELASISRAKNPTNLAKIYAQKKIVRYAQNPTQLEKDIKNFDLSKQFPKLVQAIIKEWGKENSKTSKPTECVKYTQNYKSRALIDFKNGLLRVETIDEKNYKTSLQKAIITALLMPSDPRNTKIFNSDEVKLQGMPYLFGEVKDDQNKNIQFKWRATRFANILIKNNLNSEHIKIKNTRKKVYFVNINMIKNHENIRRDKYKDYVEKFAKIYNVDKSLIYAIIKTESSFNQFAVSGSGAYGLMQIIPSTAGIDAMQYKTGKKIKPTKEYLFNARNNIELGVIYLKILSTKYLQGIYNKKSNEYCTISSYNAGAGSVLKVFAWNRNRAKTLINQTPARQIYSKLISEHPKQETRRYLQKVTRFKKDYM